MRRNGIAVCFATQTQLGRPRHDVVINDPDRLETGRISGVRVGAGIEASPPRLELPAGTHMLIRDTKELLRLAAPIAIAQAGTQLMSLVDSAVVGRVGATELAATGLGASLFFGFSIIGMGVVMGIDPLIAQSFGAGNPRAARRIFWQGIWLALALSVVICALMGTAPFLIQGIGVDPRVGAPAWTYLLVRMGNVPTLLLFLVFRSYLQSAHSTRTMVLAMIGGNVFNLLADILFVFGGAQLPSWTGPLRDVPAMGVAGAAFASVLGGVVQLAIIAPGLRGVEAGGRVSLRPNRADVTASLRLGVPVGLQMGAEYGVFALVGLLAGRMGPTPLAAHQLALTIAAFTFTVAMGIGSAGAVQVGRAIGAGDRERTHRQGVLSFILGGAVMSVSAVAFVLFPEAIARIITDQPEVIAVAVPLLAVAAVFQISDGVQAVGSGVLRGAGDTRFAFLANVTAHWLIGLPVALLLGFRMKMGIHGLWWGLCTGLVAVAIILVWRFLRLSAAGIRPVIVNVEQ